MCYQSQRCLIPIGLLCETFAWLGTVLAAEVIAGLSHGLSCLQDLKQCYGHLKQTVRVLCFQPKITLNHIKAVEKDSILASNVGRTEESLDGDITG